MKRNTRFMKRLVMPVLGAGLLTAMMGMTPYDQTTAPAQPTAAKAQGVLDCPNRFGWAEGLVHYLPADAAFPTEKPNVDCDFHQWSWEAFVWATSMLNGQPRFMSLSTPDDLLTTTKKVANGKPHMLKLAARSPHPGLDNSPQVAGAIVEADGNMLVAPNGYPVLASVHMNQSYLNTAKANMMYNGGYVKNQDDGNYFQVGAAIFKATWLRYDNDSDVPQGAYTTVAEVPVLAIDPITQNVVPTGKTVKAKVALIGLHVVGLTNGHPEFLWATFEHRYNSPRVQDGNFQASASTFYAGNFNLYRSGTAYNQVNLQNQAGSSVQLTFDVAKQQFNPVTQVVLQNQTGMETNSPNGPMNIVSVNNASQTQLRSPAMKGQGAFANYDLIGTVWMNEGVYSRSNPNWQNINQANAVGSVALANSTAETFQQVTGAVPSNPQNYNNCFSCHNPTPFSSVKPPVPAAMPQRLVAISHVITAKTSYSVPNEIQVATKAMCKDVKAGPLWNQQNAQQTCPQVCAKQGELWNGQWTTTQPGTMSVCGCCN